MGFIVERASRTRQSTGDYSYSIYENGELVASYWHDFRGDDHGIDFVGGPSEHDPVGRMSDFLQGGGAQQPLELSEKAVAYLKTKLAAK